MRNSVGYHQIEHSDQIRSKRRDRIIMRSLPIATALIVHLVCLYGWLYGSKLLGILSLIMAVAAIVQIVMVIPLVRKYRRDKGKFLTHDE